MTKYANTGLLFNKHYYKEIQYVNPEEDKFDYKKDKRNISKLKENNEILFRSSLDNTPKPIGNKNFELTTTYPGLFLGSGYPHEAGVEGELKLGFFFDYATGIPILPGSSVKGVLRNAFEVANGDYVKALLEKKLKIATSKIKDLYNKKVKIEGIKGKVPYIIASIFHGYYPAKENDKITYKQIGVYKRDIFLDAVPYGKIPEQKFLDNDFITPHENPLKNPVPLQFLKVLPGVTFRFDFKLNDIIDENGNKILTAEEKKELFRLILLDLGIGAKTNVGYGQFTNHLENNSDSKRIIRKVKQENVLNPNISKLEEGQILKGKINKLKGGVFFDLGIKSVVFPTKLIGVSTNNFKIGQVIKVKVVKKGKYFNFEIVE